MIVILLTDCKFGHFIESSLLILAGPAAIYRMLIL